MASALAMSRAFQFGTRLAAVSSSSSRTRASSSLLVRSSPMHTRTLSHRLFSTTAPLTDEQKTELENKIKQKGDEIRTLKDDGISKDDLKPHVEELLELKAQLDPSSVAPKKKQQQQPKKKKQQQQQNQKPKNDDAESDYITPRAENYSR